MPYLPMNTGGFPISPADNSTAADESHSLTDGDGNLGSTTQAEVEAVLDALAVAINANRTCLINAGLMKDS